MKKAAISAGAAWALLLASAAASAAPIGNGVRLPSITPGLLGAASASGASLPLVGNLPLVSTAALQPVLEIPLGTAQLPNKLLEPALSVVSPVALGTALPALIGLSGPVQAGVAQAANPVVTQVLGTALSVVGDINGPGPGAPAGAGSAAE